MNKAELVELASKLQVDVSGLNKAQIVKQLLGRPEELSELKDVALIDKVKMVSMQDQVNDKCEEVSRYRRESELLHAKLELYEQKLSRLSEASEAKDRCYI